jgi:hypothetical protein
VAEKADDLPALDVERDPLDRRVISIELRQLVNVDHTPFGLESDAAGPESDPVVVLRNCASHRADRQGERLA